MEQELYEVKALRSEEPALSEAEGTSAFLPRQGRVREFSPHPRFVMIEEKAKKLRTTVGLRREVDAGALST